MMINTLLTEYGLSWVISRLLYSAKLKMMAAVPATEKLFEKKVAVKRIDVFNLYIEGIETFLRALSGEKQVSIINVADKAVKGIITGFSSIELDYGYPINWHLNPLTKSLTNKQVKWYRIPDFDAERGDIKVVWEASRFTHFFYMARAYMITGDKKYYNAYSEQIEQWLKDNPYSYGANYKCGQECALRMINALMSYQVFKYYGLITDEDEKNLSKLVEVCYKKILSNFFYAHKCIKNNHTLSEITGLIIGSWCCENKKGLIKAYKLLDKEVQKQFFPDGGYIQYSFNYQRLALQLMECIFKLGEKTGIKLTERTKSRIKNSSMLMYQVQHESGDLPNYGSNDGALIFPVTVCGYRDFSPVINTAHALVEGRRLYEQGDYDEELLWFGSGKSENLCLDGIEKKPSSFQLAGFYTLRHDSGYLMVVLRDYKTRPSHMDGLHIDLWHQDKNILCDSGTYSYASDIGKKMVLTAAHNTVQINGKEQMNKHGPFIIYNWSSSRVAKHNQDSFAGTMVSGNGYAHRRNISNMLTGYMVEDEISGNGDYCVSYFHTPCNVRVVAGGFELHQADLVLCTVAVDTGDIEVKKADRSLYYLQKEEINCVCVKSSMNNKKCSMKFHIEFANLLIK